MLKKRQLVMVTRQSPLALQQADWVKAQLEAHYPALAVTYLCITTEADRLLDKRVAEIGGKGLFVRELDDALLKGQADIAVHSMKDVPMALPDGLAIPTICQREDPRDVFISNVYNSLAVLPQGARVGTSSLRRQAQLRALRGDLMVSDLRGNVNTRLKQLDAQQFDAVILAAAGMKRMHLVDRVRDYFAIEALLPAAGQGALGIACRSDDAAMLEMIAPLNDIATFQAVSAERAVCRAMNAGCMLPLAAFATVDATGLTLHTKLVSADGRQCLTVTEQGAPTDGAEIGLRAADRLLHEGAAQILETFR